MAMHCPRCDGEILPYLKTGELKQIHLIEKFPEVKNQDRIQIPEVMNYLISYQLYWCVRCKVVFYEEHESYPFLNLKQKVERKEKKKDGINKER